MTSPLKNDRLRGQYRFRATLFDKIIVLGVLGGATAVCIYFVMEGTPPTGKEIVFVLQLSMAGIAGLLVFFGAILLGGTARDLVLTVRRSNKPQAETYSLFMSAFRELRWGVAWYFSGVVSLYLLYWWSPLEKLGWYLFVVILLVSGFSAAVGAIMNKSRAV